MSSDSKKPSGKSSNAGPSNAKRAKAKQIKVLIVDDQRTFGEALEVAIGKEKDLHVVDVVTDGPSAVASAHEHRPDVVLMDVSMPGMNGLEATRRILEADPDAHVVVISGYEDEFMLARAVQAGASGLLRKTEAVVDVVNSVRQAHRGEALHDEDEVDRSMRRLHHRREQEGGVERRLNRLTPRETEILQLMAEGFSNEEIASKLDMSPNTLRTHGQNIITKLGVHSRLEALVYAIRHGKVATVDVTGEPGS